MKFMQIFCILSNTYTDRSSEIDTLHDLWGSAEVYDALIIF